MNTAKIIAVTQPLGNLTHSPGEFIAYCARVSNPDNQTNNETSPRLLKYLQKHKHWSPFEMVSVVMEVVTTRDIGRQVLRHKSCSFQEFSQRYAEVIAKAFVARELRLQDLTNRQNSIEIHEKGELSLWWQAQQLKVWELTQEVYHEAIARGIAKEQARAVLAEGLTPTTMYVSGTVRSWIHYILDRRSAGTQKEHRAIANMAQSQLLSYIPELEFIFSE